MGEDKSKIDSEAREKALREILHIISRSRADEKPVLDSIVSNAQQLCGAPFGVLTNLTEEGSRVEIVADGTAPFEPFVEGWGWPIDSDLIAVRSVREKTVLHLEDAAQSRLYADGDPARVKVVEVGIRTALAVPLISQGQAIGSMVLFRTELRPFEPDEVVLVETFAEQAVIAIENVRQFRELQTRLEREAATREILLAISQSPDDEQPVFEVILENAARLCSAPHAGLLLVNDDESLLQLVASNSASSRFIERLKENPHSLTKEESLAARAIRSGEVGHYPDIAGGYEGTVSPQHQVAVDTEGMRTALLVPLILNGEAIGIVFLYKREVEPFKDDEIALVETFAAQAVIAIENVRQFLELQTRLEREAASRKILQVISRSRADEKPVFDVILESASRLCNAPLAFLSMTDDARETVVIPAHRGARSNFSNILEHFSEPLEGSELVATIPIREGEVILSDALATDERYFTDSHRRHQLTVVEGARSLLAVPLISGELSIGAIILYRREVQPFGEDDVTLVRGFAAQAVIAIENVKQFRELQTRLEREAASRNILDVVSRSRDNETPVFDTILDHACKLCDAPLAYLCMATEDRNHVFSPARRGTFEKFGATLENLNVPLADSRLALARSIAECRVFREDDIAEHELYKSSDPDRVSMVENEGARSLLVVPLVSDNLGIGSITLYRRKVEPFSDDDVALVESFAAQAVIAIENVKQFRELQTRLEREAASRDILDVVSRSRDNENPVFDTILEHACKLCRADSAFMGVVDESGEHMSSPAQRGASPAFAALTKEWSVQLASSKLTAVRAIQERRVFRIDDVADTDLYREGDPQRVNMVDIEGIHSILTVPLLTADAGLGAIVLYRKQIDPFSDEDVALVEAFAAQAVIAIENVRQFKALEAKTEEVQALNAGLEERVEEQVGEIERMGRLKRFLSPQVADAVVSAGDDKLLSSHRALIATLFCDIRGFTAFCETAEPEETIEVLQTYHEEMGKLMSEHQAGVDHRMGDGIMVIFNDPLPCEDPAGDALRLGMAMRDRMAELGSKWRKLGHRLGFGVGISLGYATVGMVGSEGRYEYTANGTAVNLAARLCDKAEDGEILISPRAYTAVEEFVTAESAGEFELKGIKAPVEIFRVIGMK